MRAQAEVLRGLVQLSAHHSASSALEGGGGWARAAAWQADHHLSGLCPLQAKHLASQYWGSSRPAAVRRDPSLPYLEQYRIDASQFQELFASLTPWACGPHTPVLAGRMFRLLDRNKDSLINFKEFVTGISEWPQGRFPLGTRGGPWGPSSLSPVLPTTVSVDPEEGAEQGAGCPLGRFQRELAVRRRPREPPGRKGVQMRACVGLRVLFSVSPISAHPPQAGCTTET